MKYSTDAPPNWYSTPEGGLRYWDGEEWTEHYVQPPSQVRANQSYTPRQWAMITVLLTILAIPVVLMGILGAVLGPVESGENRRQTLSAVDDINVGEVRDLGYGNSAVVLTVTNSDSQSMDYTVSVIATDRSSSPEARAATRETIDVQVSDVPPGATAQVDVVSTEGDPTLRVFTVAYSSKQPSDPEP